MEDIEIELKLKLEQPEILIKWLKENAELVGTSEQSDQYFDPPNKSFTYVDAEGYKDADEWFRVRSSEKGNEICYKLWHRDEKTGKSLYADEIETGVDDPKQILKILERLKFKPTSLIEKHRESYKYKDFQFDCDEIKGLGFFVEIEFKGKIEDPTKGNQKIYDLIKEIGIKNWKKTKRGYPCIQWNPGKDHFEES